MFDKNKFIIELIIIYIRDYIIKMWIINNQMELNNKKLKIQL